MAVVAMEVVPLSDALGAEIRGVDLRAPLDGETRRSLDDAWRRHIVLLFRGQELDIGRQTAFAAVFGEVGRHFRPKEIRNEAEDLGPNVMLVSNVRENGKPIGSIPDGEMMFHSDTPYIERPHKATVLYAVEIPSTGGNTLIANSYAAAETLPADVKRRLAGRRAVHAFEYGATLKSGRFDRSAAPHHAHPVFRKHPATGRSALFVSELMTEEIVGLPEEESRDLLDLLFAHQRRPEFVHEHVWRPGDLLIWDNRCSIHARTDFPREERRLLRRLTVLDEHPVLMGEPPGLPA